MTSIKANGIMSGLSAPRVSKLMHCGIVLYMAYIYTNISYSIAQIEYNITPVVSKSHCDNR